MAIRVGRVQHSALPAGPNLPAGLRPRPTELRVAYVAAVLRFASFWATIFAVDGNWEVGAYHRGKGSRMMTRTLGRAVPSAATCQNPVDWDREADVVVIGAGATGLPAAIVACEAGCSVILVEAENHIGGHAITSGGNLPLGGGTSYQKKYGIEDSPDLFFQDLTDWSVVETNGFPPYPYNDREIIRAFADNSVAAFEFLLAHGVKVIDRLPNSVGHEIGVSALRTMQIDVTDWPMVHTGQPADPSDPEIRAGAGLVRPLQAAAGKACGENFL